VEFLHHPARRWGELRRLPGTAHLTNIHHTLKKKPLDFADLAEEIIENLEAGLNSFRQVLTGLKTQ